MEAFIGTILPFAGTFAPVNWLFCAGQTLNISQNTALFSIIGTQYGGNGTTSFNLPDLRSRTIVGAGQGTGLSPYVPGQFSGVEQTSLTVQQMPQHNHTVNAQAVRGTQQSPANNLLAVTLQGSAIADSYVPPNVTNPAPVTMAANAISMVGNNQPVSMLQPYLAINYIICINGIYPPRG